MGTAKSMTAHSTDARHRPVRNISSRNTPHHKSNTDRHRPLDMGPHILTPLLILHLHRIPTIHPTAATMEAPAFTSAFPAYSLTSDSAAGTSATLGMAGISGDTSEGIAPDDTRVSSHLSKENLARLFRFFTYSSRTRPGRPRFLLGWALLSPVYMLKGEFTHALFVWDQQ